MGDAKGSKHVVGLSGGKDSSCLALALKERHPEITFEYICTPTGDELPELFDHLDHMERLLGQPIKRLGIGKSLFDLIDEMNMVPNFQQRWCTRMLKIEPTIEYMATLPPGSKLYVGLRADEEERVGIYGDDVQSVFPFREWGWDEARVWKYLDERGVCIPQRTDCATCYHQRIIEWYRLWLNHRDLFDKGAAAERRVGYSFRSAGRDTWPAFLDELSVQFERVAKGERKIRVFKRDSARDSCRVCSL